MGNQLNFIPIKPLDCLINVENRPKSSEIRKREINIQTLEEEYAVLDKKFQDSIKKKDYISGGNLQVKLEAKKGELDKARYSMNRMSLEMDKQLKQSKDQITNEVSSLKISCSELEEKLKKSISNQDYMTAGSIQKNIDVKKRKLKEAQQKLQSVV